MREKRFSALALIGVAVATLAVALGALALAAWIFLGPQALTLLQGLGLINARFVGEYDVDEVLDSAMSGMVVGLGDRWSYYLDEQGYAATLQRRQNAYTGIGVTVSYEDESGLRLIAVTEDGPAARAGLAEGELILSVDGVTLSGEKRYEGAELIQAGEDGSSVTLEVQGVDGTVRTVEVIRGKLETNPVEYALLPSNVGYVHIKNFYERSADGVKTAVDDLLSQGATALVFDMRNNGGGYLEQLTDMLDYLLPEGPIFRSKDRAGVEKVTQSDAACIDLPMVTLVNKNTYSAAEFFAAELQEQGVGLIVGEKTSGKGYSQQTYFLPGSRGMGISTGAYFTGEGTSLIGTGVTLDAELSLSAEDALRQSAGKLPYEEDQPLQKALELLSEVQ